MKKLLFALWAVTLVSIFNFASDKTHADYQACEENGTCTTSTDVYVTVTGGTLCIWSPESFNFGTYTGSSSIQTVTGQFPETVSGVRYVDDQKGADIGYYTTVQISVLTWDNWYFIAWDNVSMMSKRTAAGNDAWENTGAGAASPRVYTNPSLFSVYQDIWTAPVEFINRDSAANFGLVGKYIDYPFLQLTIPAYTPAGNYHGIITYTLTEPGH